MTKSDVMDVSHYLRKEWQLRKLNNVTIVPGLGWRVSGEPNGKCDGTATGICGRTTTNRCLLSGHMDARGGILGNSDSGWLIMDIPALEKGIVIVKMETWHNQGEMDDIFAKEEMNANDKVRTLEENPSEEEDMRRENDDSDHSEQWMMRKTKHASPELPDTFIFQFAIDGQITSWKKDEFLEQKKIPEHAVEIFTLLDNHNMSFTKETVAVALRIINSGTYAFLVTHVYWA